MKLQATNARTLNEALQKSAKCTNTKNANRLLSAVLLTQKPDGSFLFVSSTGDAQLTVPAPLEIVEGQFTQSLVLPISLITQLLGTLPPCPITLDFDDEGKGKLTMTYCTSVGDSKNERVKEGQMSTTYESGELFPLLNQPKEELTRMVLPLACFNEAISRSADFVSRDEFRPALCCMCMQIADDRSQLDFVACDGNILARTIHTNNPKTGGTDFFLSGTPQTLLLHRQHFRIFSVFDGEGDITIETDKRMHRFVSGDHELICKGIEDRYPNYKAIIPLHQPFHLTFCKKEMLDILKRVSLCSDKNNQMVKLTVHGMFIDVEASDIDFVRSASDQVLIEDAKATEGFSMAFSIPRFTAALQAIPDESATIYYTDETHAIVVQSPDPAARVLTLCTPCVRF